MIFAVRFDVVITCLIIDNYGRAWIYKETKDISLFDFDVYKCMIKKKGWGEEERNITL